MRTIKVFASGKSQEELAKDYTVIEKYPAFVLVEVPLRKVPGLSRRHPVEDITQNYTIRTETRKIQTKPLRTKAGGELRRRATSRRPDRLPPGPHHYLVQFVGPIKERWLGGIRSAGGELRAPYGDFTYVVRATKTALDRIAQLRFVRWTGHLSHGDRIGAGVAHRVGRKRPGGAAPLPRTRLLAGAYVVEFFGPRELRQAGAKVRKLGFKILSRTPSASRLAVQTGASGSRLVHQIDRLAAVHGVRTIHNRSIKRTSNNVARTLMRTARTTSSAGSGLTGRGETIGVCDTGLDSGDPATIHEDFSGRIDWIKSYAITPDYTRYILNPEADDGPADRDSGHGTHVAGSALGTGAGSRSVSGLSSPIRGLAPGARLVFQAVEQEMEWKNSSDYDDQGRFVLAGLPNDLKTLFADAYAKNARVHSNSWSGGDGGVYDDQCQQLDEFVWVRKEFCVVVAAGNDGTDKDGDGKINPMSVASPASAKNCITVGACESKRTQFNAETYGAWWPRDYPVAPFKNNPMADNPDQLVAFSSRGPTADGRFKPDIVAPGTFILSTRSRWIAQNNTAWAAFPSSKLYFYMGGTSMATPLTSGAVALMREYLRKVKRISKPSAALLKASLIFGADRLPGSGAGEVVDNHQGYGRVNVDAVTAPQRGSVLFKDVTSGLRTGQSQTITVQVKNVPFFRAVLAYTDYPGSKLINNLNLIVTSPSGRTFVGNSGGVSGQLQADSKNNVEVVHVRNPGSGRWTIAVVASNVPHGLQDYALVYLGPRVS